MNERQIFKNLLLEHKQELCLDYNCKNRAEFTYHDVNDNQKKAKEIVEQVKSLRKQDKIEGKEQRKKREIKKIR